VVTFNMTSSFKRHAPLSLLKAVNKLELLLLELKNDIDLVPIVQFDPRYTKPMTLTSVDILGESLDEDIVVTLDTYTQSLISYMYAPVISHVKDVEPTRIYYNTRILNSGKSVQEWIENLAHELIHVYDHHSPYRFGHGDNSLKGKDNSAPVKLSKIIASMAIGLTIVRADDVNSEALFC
jgi:hypothetical protein